MKRALLIGTLALLSGMAALLIALGDRGGFADLTGIFGGGGAEEDAPAADAAQGLDGGDGAKLFTATFSGESSAPDHGPPDGVLVQVVEKGNGKRLGGAEVTFLDPAVIDRASIQEALLSGGRTLETLLGRFGRRFLADANGELRVPRFRDQAGVMARYGGLWSLLEIRPGMADPIRLELEASYSLFIQVIDEEGRPRAGVPLALRAIDGSFPVDVWRGQSQGDEGLAEVRHVRQLAGQVDCQGPASLFATFGFPLAEPVEVPIDPGTPPAEPVRLPLPRTGRIVVQLRDVAGEPVRHGALVSLQAASADGSDQGHLYGALVNHPARVEDGRAVFTHVGLGLRLKVEAWMGDRVRPATREIPGPALDSAEVVCDLAFSERYPAVVGRACDENGVALRSCALQMTLRTTSDRAQGSAGGPVRTDEEGRFRVVVKSEAAERERRELELAVAEPATGRVRLLGHADLPSSLAPGDTDIGTVVLRTAALVVAGEVLDSDGRALRGAVVSVEVMERDPRDGSVAWAPDFDLRAQTDAAGRFSICGRASGRELRITAAHPEHLCREPQVAGAGAQGVKLVLSRGGAVEGSLLLDPEVRPSDLEVILEPVAGAAAGCETTLRPEPDGSFRFRVCPPGLSRVAVCVRDDRVALLTVDGVAVRPGETTRDPRLSGLDLRSRLRAVTVTAVDPEDRPVPEVRVLVGRPGERDAAGPWRRGTQGVVRLLFRAPAADLLVEASEHRPTWLRGATGDVRVVLRRGLPVRILLSGGAAVSAMPATLEAAVTPVAGPAAAPSPAHSYAGGAGGPRPLDRTGQLRVLLPGPGRYRISWSVSRKGRWPEAGVGLPADQSAVIDVVESEGEQSFLVALSPDSLEAALRDLEP